MKYPRASRALRRAPDPMLKRARFARTVLLPTVGNLGLSWSGAPPWSNPGSAPGYPYLFPKASIVPVIAHYKPVKVIEYIGVFSKQQTANLTGCFKLDMLGIRWPKMSRINSNFECISNFCMKTSLETDSILVLNLNLGSDLISVSHLFYKRLSIQLYSSCTLAKIIINTQCWA